MALPVGIGIFRTVSSAFGAEDAGGGASGNIARYSATVAAYGTVVAGHALCCWKAASVLRFDTLNRARLLAAAKAYVRGGGGAVPSVEEAGEAEGVYRTRVPSGMPTLGASLPDAARDWAHLEALVVLEESVGTGTPRSEAEELGAETGRMTGREGKKAEREERERWQRQGQGQRHVAVLGEIFYGEQGVGVVSSEGEAGDERDVDRLRRQFVLGWDTSRRVPAVLLDASASPRDVIAAALAAAHAAAAASTADADRLDTEVAAAAYAYSDQHLVWWCKLKRAGLIFERIWCKPLKV